MIVKDTVVNILSGWQLVHPQVPGCSGCQERSGRSDRRGSDWWSSSTSKFQVSVWICGAGGCDRKSKKKSEPVNYCSNIILFCLNVFSSLGWCCNGNSDSQREPELLSSTAPSCFHFPKREGAKSQQTHWGTGTWPSGWLQGKEARRQGPTTFLKLNLDPDQKLRSRHVNIKQNVKTFKSTRQEHVIAWRAGRSIKMIKGIRAQSPLHQW